MKALKTAFPYFLHLITGVGLSFAAAGQGWLRAEETPVTGQAIYEKLCVECHGKQGEGVAKKHEEPLYGERSIESLARLIDRTMPDGAPEKCSAEEAQKVAAYIYEAFYSPAAQARLHPARRAPAHLTNRQFRESVADLLASFGSPPPPGEGRGLAAKYFQSNGMNKKAKKGPERVDRAVDFDFGEGGPAEGIGAEQYSIAWQGSLLAKETGWHEFRLITPNGARLYLNSELREGDGNRRDDSDARRQVALIDGWVSSGDTVREESGRLFLLGGRSYPLRVDYFKFKDKRGSIRLEWKPPHGVWSVLSAPYLSPGPASRMAVVSTSFPPDDASVGYERGTAVSKAWHEAATKAAIEAANEVVGRLGSLSGVPGGEASDRVQRLRQFVATLAERAFRRPLTDEARQLYVDRAFAGGVPPDLAVKRAVMLVLTSPRFLYPELGGSVDPYTVASRLALGLWDSLPDAALVEAAGRDELRSPEQVRAQAQRMMQDPRAKAKLGQFFQNWLTLEAAQELNKDAAAYPGFNAALVGDLRRSLELFVDHVVWSEASDYRELLLADYVFVNPALARFYGVAAPAGTDFVPVKFDPSQRAGIFTHPFLLAAFSYHKSSSPIHRGVFLTRHVMGRSLKPPPIAVAFVEEEFDPSLTMREKVTELTSKTACITCHATINPLGFSLENYDAVGRFRTVENNKPVNAQSDYTTAEGEVVRLHGPRDLAMHTSVNDDARRGFVRQLFHYAIKQPTAAYGVDALEKLDDAFDASGYHVRNLFVEINILAARHGLETPKPASP